MMLATLWPATVKFFTDNPIARFLLAAFLFIVGWTLLKNHLKQAGAEAERASIAKKQAKVREAVIERKDEIISQERTSADTALAARQNW